MMTKGLFAGANVFLSRSLVPPEIYDSLHDALRLNGAQLFLCSDPSRNSPNDYHVISSPDHEKFADLKAKGCNMLGPHCILSCAKERRSLPKLGFTCCLAMDGVKVLASGFENEEKARIAQLVSAMGGFLHSKTSLDISFVIVKNVLAAKYKWAINVLKKPVVSMSWLNQCWLEHRLVPQEPYRILPFVGLTICVTRIPLDERKEIGKLIVQNGGQYSGDLTKKCTHLVSDAPEGDKYLVAKRWGHIHIVTRRWVDFSVSRKACLEEEQYSIHGSSLMNINVRNHRKEQPSQDCSNLYSQCMQTDLFGDLEASASQKINSTFSDANIAVNEINESLTRDEEKTDAHIAEDSQDDDNDLYLSNCRILLLGFDEKEMRKLVDMIRKGGGSRHMLLNEKLTHIIIGTLSEMEGKEVRRLAAWGVINVVKRTWLEECDAAKKELLVSQRHIASDFLRNEPACLSKAPSVGADIKEGKFPPLKRMRMGHNDTMRKPENGYAFEKVQQKGLAEVQLPGNSHLDSLVKSNLNSQLLVNKLERKSNDRLLIDQKHAETSGKSAEIFKGHSFCFSASFPEERRYEIMEWIRTGGGALVGSYEMARFIVECHGAANIHTYASNSAVVSPHWIRSCLLEGAMQDISSHILYSPLQCHIPLPGFGGLRFCISQYESKERQLLRNLCFTLGSECKERLTRKISHLVCKFASGPKYEKSCEWGIQSVTAEWISECIRQDKLVPEDLYRPKTATTKDREAGACLYSQYPTQAGLLFSEDRASEVLTETEKPAIHSNFMPDDSPAEEPELRGHSSKLSKICRDDIIDATPTEFGITKGSTHRSTVGVPDVATAIEDLLAQSTKIQDLKFPVESGCRKSTFSSDGFENHANPPPTSRISKHWSKRTLECSTCTNHPGIDSGSLRPFDAFSETQTDSQVVGYEEDLSGRQKIIDRVRSQSLTLTPGRQNET